MNKEDQYHEANQEEMLAKFHRVLMEVFHGAADAMLGELETRSVEKEDYETAAQMRDIRSKIND